jgi:RpiR family transcriptional regulator, carbohydrate utilization regulator
MQEMLKPRAWQDGLVNRLKKLTDAKRQGEGGKMIFEAIESNLNQLRPSERLVANFVLGRPSVVIHMSIADLAERAEVSEPTIMRFCKALGLLGFMEFKLALVRDLERRTFAMNRCNPAVKGPAGFGQALFARVVTELEGLGDTLPLDRIDEILEYCGVSRAISIVHDGNEAALALTLVEGLLACRLEASAIVSVNQAMRNDGRVVIALGSAPLLTGFNDFCETVIEQDGKIICLGFDAPHSSLSLGMGISGTGCRSQILYLALAETLRTGIQARLSRTGAFADTATDLLQSQREIAYGDARRRDRQSAQGSDTTDSQNSKDVRRGAQSEETA